MNVKGYRVGANLKISDVADRLGICRESYRRKENRDRRFTLEEAVELAKMFGITIEEFYKATKG